MGLFRRRRSSEEERSGGFTPAAYGFDEWATAVLAASGGSVSIERALRDAAVWRCMEILSGSVSETPVDVVRVEGKRRVPVLPAPQVVVAPSGIVTADVWLVQLVNSLISDGNAFGDIVAVDPKTARPTQIELFAPSTVTNRRVSGGRIEVTIGGKVRQVWPHGDVWHCPGKMLLPGSPFGLSPIAFGARSITTALAAEDFSAQFFEGGGHLTAAIYSDQVLTDEQAKAIKASFRRATTGSREPAVFGSGLRYEPLQSTPSDAAALDLLRFEIEQRCRFIGVPPSMVYAAISGQNVTYANVTQADLSYLKHSLGGYFGRIERAWSALIARPQIVRFNRDATLRSDPLGRAQVQKLRLEMETTSVNEVRADEDQEPWDDPRYDLPGIPGRSTPPAGGTNPAGGA